MSRQARSRWPRLPAEAATETIPLNSLENVQNTSSARTQPATSNEAIAAATRAHLMSLMGPWEQFPSVVANEQRVFVPASAAQPSDSSDPVSRAGSVARSSTSTLTIGTGAVSQLSLRNSQPVQAPQQPDLAAGFTNASRTSLDAEHLPAYQNGSSLRALQQAGAAAETVNHYTASLEADISLPASRASSGHGSYHHFPGIKARRNSERNGSHVEDNSHNNYQNSNEDGTDDSQQPNRLSYWQRVESLSKVLPHLNSLHPSHGRHRHVGRISCIDYYRGNSHAEIAFELSLDRTVPRPTLYAYVQELKTFYDNPPNIRVVLVEDLSSELIECLGDGFEIDPEFFAEHLNRSGYNRWDHYDDLPKNWWTHKTEKTYSSLKWHRPVRQNPDVSAWLRPPCDILNRADKSGAKGGKDKLNGLRVWEDVTQGTKNEVKAKTNIFRRARTLSARPAGNAAERRSDLDPDAGDRDEEDPPKWLSDAIPTAWEEKASYIRFEKADVPIVILLLDPLPVLSHKVATSRHRGRSPQNSLTTAMSQTTLVDMGIPMHLRAPWWFPLNKYRARGHDIAYLSERTKASLSTARSIEEWAHPSGYHTPGMDPLEALLRVVLVDSCALFSALGRALDEISEDSLDDYLMARQLPEWRKLMSDFEIEIPEMAEAVREFVEFAFHNDQMTGFPESVQTIVSDLNKEIDDFRRRLDNAYTGLRSDMQFAESRRSINEAQSVAKLTELAFIFIPLSFTCSIFSMSINELENGVPIWVFLVCALVLTLLSYSIRLLVTSEFLAQSSRRALLRYWDRRNQNRGDSVPLLTLFSLTVQDVWSHGGKKFFVRSGLVLFILSFIMVPIAFMWTSTDLGIGFNSAVTSLFILACAAAALSAFVLMGLNDGQRVGWLLRHTESESELSNASV